MTESGLLNVLVATALAIALTALFVSSLGAWGAPPFNRVLTFSRRHRVGLGVVEAACWLSTLVMSFTLSQPSTLEWLFRGIAAFSALAAISRAIRHQRSARLSEA